MEIIKELNLNAWPVWLVAIFIISLKVYNDLIKPYYDRRLQMKIESEKRNTEVKRFNEESNRWSKLFRYIEHNVEDVLSFTQAQVIYVSMFRDGERDLFLRLVEIIDKNDIKNEMRRHIIHNHLASFLINQKNRLARALDAFKCNNIKLSSYILSITSEHSSDFLSDIEKVLFDNNIEYLRKKDDLNLMLNSHYNNHVSEAIEWLKNLDF